MDITADTLYPPAPRDVPRNLTRPGLGYRLRVVLVLAALFLFLLVYLALMGASLVVLAWALNPPAELLDRLARNQAANVFFIFVRLGLCAAAALFFVFLLKGFLRRQPDDASHYLEVDEAGQPDLFRFIRQLCAEVGCTPPARVYVSYEVNAAVIFPTSIANLFVPPPRNLLLGLGLINDLDLTEFKALLAHEFGHFAQRSVRLSGYVTVVHRVLHNMIYVRDRWDDWMVRGFDTPLVSAVIVPLYMLVDGTRSVLGSLFRVLDLAFRSLSRQMEYNADSVAVSVAGSDAVVHLLFKSDFGQLCQDEAARDLLLAAEHERFTQNVFYHQRRAADALRAARNDPTLGVLPAPASEASTPVAVFAPGATSRLAMWAYHPAPFDRERNAKRHYLRSPDDRRAAWLLFRDAAQLQRAVTRQFYAVALGVEPEGELVEPEQVAAFLDEERSAFNLDVRFRELYDNRYVELTDFDALIREAPAAGPPGAEAIDAYRATLESADHRAWLAGYRQRRAEYDLLSSYAAGNLPAGQAPVVFRGEQIPQKRASALLSQVREELDEDGVYLARLDRSIFAIHDQLAAQLGEQLEYRTLYRFLLHVQALEEMTWDQAGRIGSVIRFLMALKAVHLDQLGGLLATLGEARDGLAEVFRQATLVTVPPLKHVEGGVPLTNLLGPAPQTQVLESADTALGGTTLTALHNQVSAIGNRLARIRGKSLNAILTMQERLVVTWSARCAPGSQTVTPAASADSN